MRRPAGPRPPASQAAHLPGPPRHRALGARIPQSRAAGRVATPPFPALRARVGLRLLRLLRAPSCGPAACCAEPTAPHAPTCARTRSQRACGWDAELGVAVTLQGLRGCRVRRLLPSLLLPASPSQPLKVLCVSGRAQGSPVFSPDLCVEIFHTLENCHLLSLQK